MKKGFSLVELSIVIVIIGLLLAGISSGTKLMKQAELRNLIAELEEIKMNYTTFKSTYNAIPGDFASAELFFNSCAVTPSNCNGNGDGNITTAIDITDETSKATIHMREAELMGTENLTLDLQDDYAGDMIEYVGASSIGQGVGYFFGGYDTNIGTATDSYSSLFTNGIAVYLGSYNAGTTNKYIEGAISPLSAYQIDVKIDDGATIGANITGHDSGNFRTADGFNAVTACIGGNGYAANVQLGDSCFIGYLVD